MTRLEKCLIVSTAICAGALSILGCEKLYRKIKRKYRLRGDHRDMLRTMKKYRKIRVV